MSDRYDPVDHWNTREHPNTAEDPGIHPVEHDFFGPLFKQANSLLELGPGVGRLFPLYKSVGAVSTLDLSTNYDSRAQDAANRAGISVSPNFIKEPLSAFPFEDGAFDVGIATHVLMHIPFENIEHSMSELARCCKRVAVVTVVENHWPRPGTQYDPKWHCFAHDYDALCQKLGLSISDKTIFRETDRLSSFGFVYGKGDLA